MPTQHKKPEKKVVKKKITQKKKPVAAKSKAVAKKEAVVTSPPATKKRTPKQKAPAVAVPEKAKAKSAKVKAKKEISVDKSLQNKGISEKQAGHKSTTQQAKKERQNIFLNILFNKQQFPNIHLACKEAGISRTLFYDWRDNDPEFQVKYHEWEESITDKYEADLYRNSAAGDSKAIVFYLERKARHRGYGKEADSSKVKAILKRTLDGDLTPLEAAYEINMLGLPLPEVLKLQLSKVDHTPPPDDAKCPTVEEMERKAQEAMDSIQRDLDHFVPERRKEVIELKEQMKNMESFGPDARD